MSLEYILWLCRLLLFPTITQTLKMHCIMWKCDMSSLASAMLKEMLYNVKWWFTAENQMKVRIALGRQQFGNPNIYISLWHQDTSVGKNEIAVIEPMLLCSQRILSFWLDFKSSQCLSVTHWVYTFFPIMIVFIWGKFIYMHMYVLIEYTYIYLHMYLEYIFRVLYTGDINYSKIVWRFFIIVMTIINYEHEHVLAIATPKPQT